MNDKCTLSKDLKGGILLYNIFVDSFMSVVPRKNMNSGDRHKKGKYVIGKF